MNKLNLNQDLPFLLHGLSRPEEEEFMRALKPLVFDLEAKVSDASRIYSDYENFVADFKSHLSWPDWTRFQVKNPYTHALERVKTYFEDVKEIHRVDGDVFYDMKTGADLLISCEEDSGYDIEDVADSLRYSAQYYTDSDSAPDVVELPDVSEMIQYSDLDYDVADIPFDLLEGHSSEDIDKVMMTLKGLDAKTVSCVVASVINNDYANVCDGLSEAKKSLSDLQKNLSDLNLSETCLISMAAILDGNSPQQMEKIIRAASFSTDVSNVVTDPKTKEVKIRLTSTNRSENLMVRLLSAIQGLPFDYKMAVLTRMNEVKPKKFVTFSQDAKTKATRYSNAQVGDELETCGAAYTYKETLAQHREFLETLIDERNSDDNPKNDLKNITPDMILAMVAIESDGISDRNQDGLVQISGLGFKDKPIFESYFEKYGDFDFQGKALSGHKQDYRSNLLVAAYYMDRECFDEENNPYRGFARGVACYNVSPVQIGSGYLRERSPEDAETAVNHMAKCLAAWEYLSAL